MSQLERIRAQVEARRLIFDASRMREELLTDATSALLDLVLFMLDLPVSQIRISSVSSGTHTVGSLHYVGNAVDVGNEEVAGIVVPRLYDEAARLRIDELIYDSSQIWNAQSNAYSLKHGKPLAYSHRTLRSHRSHFHVSVLATPLPVRTYDRVDRHIFVGSSLRHPSPADSVVDLLVGTEPSLNGRVRTLQRVAVDRGPDDEDSLDSVWTSAGLGATRLALDLDTLHSSVPDFASAAFGAAFDLYRGNDSFRDTFESRFAGDEEQPSPGAPVAESVAQLGLAADSATALVGLLRGESGPPDVPALAQFLSHEMRRHLPPAYGELAGIASSLLAPKLPKAAHTLTQGFKHLQTIHSVASLFLGGGVSPALALGRTLGAGLGLFDATSPSERSDPAVRQALAAIQQELSTIRGEIAEVKAKIDKLALELDAFREETAARFTAVLEQLNQGFERLEHNIRADLDDLRGQLELALNAIMSVDRKVELSIDVDLRQERDRIRSEFEDAHKAAFNIFGPGDLPLEGANLARFREYEAIFSNYALRSSMSEAMAGSTLVENFEQAATFLDASEGVEWAFGLLTRLARLSGIPIADKRLPNPIEWARGCDALVQLLTLAPRQEARRYTDDLRAALALGRDIQSVLRSLRQRDAWNTRDIRAVTKHYGKYAVMDLVERYVGDHQTKHKFKLGSEHRYNLGPWATPFTLRLEDPSFSDVGYLIDIQIYDHYLDRSGPPQHAFLQHDKLGPRWYRRSHDILRHLEMRGLLTRKVLHREELGGVEDPLPHPEATTWRSDNVFDMTEHVVELQYDDGHSHATFILREHTSSRTGSTIRWLYGSNSKNEPIESTLDTMNIIRRLVDLLNHHEARHYEKLDEAVRTLLESDTTVIPAWQGWARTRLFLHRVQFHHLAARADVQAQLYETPESGGIATSRADLLRAWNEVWKSATYSMFRPSKGNLDMKSWVFAAIDRTRDNYVLVDASITRINALLTDLA